MFIGGLEDFGVVGGLTGSCADGGRLRVRSSAARFFRGAVSWEELKKAVVLILVAPAPPHSAVRSYTPNS